MTLNTFDSDSDSDDAEIPSKNERILRNSRSSRLQLPNASNFSSERNFGFHFAATVITTSARGWDCCDKCRRSESLQQQQDYKDEDARSREDPDKPQPIDPTIWQIVSAAILGIPDARNYFMRILALVAITGAAWTAIFLIPRFGKTLQMSVAATLNDLGNEFIRDEQRESLFVLQLFEPCFKSRERSMANFDEGKRSGVISHWR